MTGYRLPNGLPSLERERLASLFGFTSSLVILIVIFKLGLL